MTKKIKIPLLLFIVAYLSSLIFGLLGLQSGSQLLFVLTGAAIVLTFLAAGLIYRHYSNLTERLRPALRQSERRVAELTTLHQVSIRLGVERDPVQIMETVVEQVQELIHASDVRIFQYDPAQDQLRLIAFRGGAIRPLDFNTPPRPDGITAAAARTGQIQLVNDPASHPLFAGEHMEWPLQAIVSLPISRTDRVFAVLNVAFLNDPHKFTENELRVLNVLVEQTALALENAVLYQSLEDKVTERTAELSQRVHQLDLITYTGRYIASLIDQETLLPTVADLIRAAFNYYAVSIMLIDREANELYLSALATVEPAYLETGVLRLAMNGESVIGRVAVTGESILIEDVQNKPDYHHTELLPDTRAEVALPLVVNDEVLGVLDLQSKELHDFQPESVQVLQILADQIAVVTHNARLYQSETAARRTAETLREMGQVVSSTLDLKELLERILISLRSVIPYNSATIMLLKEDSLQIQAVRGFENSERVEGVQLVLADHPLNWSIIETGQAICIEDVHDEPRWFSNIPGSQPVRSWLGIPLITAGEIIGMLTLDSHQPEAYQADQIPLVSAFATQAAIALQNASLFQAAQEAQAEAEEANRMKSQFLANMSHELRTPLNSIINFAYLLSIGTEGPLSAGQDDLIRRIEDSGQHLLGLINDILDLSKIEAGRLELSFESIDLRHLIYGVMSTGSGLLRNKDVLLQQDISEKLPPVWADRTRVRQILLNLLSNAAKFTEQGHIILRAWENGDWVTISVEDTGIGIKAEDIPRAFAEFVQVDGQLTRRTGGTGLGLSISKRFVEMHGGQIWAESEPGAGSTFYFTLPRHTEVLEPVETAEIPVEARVLVIDDDPSARETIARQLEHGYQVVRLNDSRQAVEKAQETRPDVIVLDVLMPQQDGWEVLQRLKNNALTRNIPVIVCSVLQEHQLASSLGANEYLVKPVKHEEVRRVVEQFAPPGGKVLAVDDDPNALEIIRRTLGGTAYRVTTASDGWAGLTAARQLKPDVIVLDLMMPGLSGFEVLAALRADPMTAQVPVVVATAKDLTAEERVQLQADAAALLQKGQFSHEEFNRIIRRAITRKPESVEDRNN